MSDEREPIPPGVTDPAREPELPREPEPPRERRPIIERLGWPPSPACWRSCSAVAAASWVGGELFLAVMGAIGCAMTLWVGLLTLIRG
jgi:hypothetical protein